MMIEKESLYNTEIMEPSTFHMIYDIGYFKNIY
jgi:hypothetical protein